MVSLNDVHYRGLKGKLEVICGDKKGYFLGGRCNLDKGKTYLVRCLCSDCETKRCVPSNVGGCIYSMRQFEKHGGREAAAKWRASFKVLGSTGSEESIKCWIAETSADMAIRYPVGSVLCLLDPIRNRWEEVTVVRTEGRKLNATLNETNHWVRFSNGNEEKVLLSAEEIKPVEEAAVAQGAAAAAAEGGAGQGGAATDMEDGEIPEEGDDGADSGEQAPLLDDDTEEAAPEEAAGDAADQNDGDVMEVEEGEMVEIGEAGEGADNTCAAEGEQGNGTAVDTQTPQPLAPVAAPPATTAVPVAPSEAPASEDGSARLAASLPAKRLLVADEAGPSAKKAKQDDEDIPEEIFTTMELMKTAYKDKKRLREELEREREAREAAEAQAVKDRAELEKERTAKEAAEAQASQDRAALEREREARKAAEAQAVKDRAALEKERADRKAAQTLAKDERTVRGVADALAKKERGARKAAEAVAATERAASVQAKAQSKKDQTVLEEQKSKARAAAKAAAAQVEQERDARKAAEAAAARYRAGWEAAMNQLHQQYYGAFTWMEDYRCAMEALTRPVEEAAPES